jgi:hypothetical protein
MVCLLTAINGDVKYAKLMELGHTLEADDNSWKTEANSPYHICGSDSS